MAAFTHASLFSGIDGFSLAAEQLGWKTAFFCEVDPFCRAHIKRRFGATEYGKQGDHAHKPILYGNIKETNFEEWRGKIDILSGGFPCQPHSVAGLQLAQNDPRHLWPDMLRCIQQIRPRYVVAENVAGIVNSGGGVVFEQMLTGLESEGYQAWPLDIPAAGVNAWHKRQRIWFLAILGDTEHDGRTAAPQRRNTFGHAGSRPQEGEEQAEQPAGASGHAALFPNAKKLRAGKATDAHQAEGA